MMSMTPEEARVQRVRNVLTLEERVRAIHAFDRKPMYTKIAKMFNCSWEQIKNIICNRQAILEFYEATRSADKHIDADREDLRRRELDFLGECIYEYIQRAQYHQNMELTEEVIRRKALEFRDIIMIRDFIPNKPWINLFKATYNISLSNRQIVLTRRPPSSLDLKDIITFCSKQQSSQDIGETCIPNETTPGRSEDGEADDSVERRRRKIDFMERALYEYIQRFKFHGKSKVLTDRLRQVAIELRDLLKINDFFPTERWLMHFKHRYDFSISQDIIVSPNRTPPLSLDLRDILSYCSRNGQKVQKSPTTVKLALKNLNEKIERPPRPSLKRARPCTITTAVPVIDLDAVVDDDDVVAIDIKPETIEINDDDVDCNANVASTAPRIPTPPQPLSPHPLKIKKIVSLSNCDTQESGDCTPQLWSTPTCNTQTDQLPNGVHNYADALKWLKPLEEFALLEENYRVIGLISQLEDIFKNPPKKNDTEYEHE